MSSLPSLIQFTEGRPQSIAIYVGGFALALLSALLLTYLVRQRARRAGLFDPVDSRKLHTAQIPRVGGVAIFWSVMLVLGVLVAFSDTGNMLLATPGLVVILAGAACIHALGLWDDLRPMRARYKFVVQILIAIGVHYAGVQVTSLALPIAGVVEFGPVASLLFTVIWLVGITNAFNLIDGLDGLASGAALFAMTTMFVVAIINGQPGAATVTLVLAGATLAFLFYNFHPASIFLGDSGSLFLGFMLAGVGLLSSQKSQTVVAVAIPIVSLGLPVLDTALAIVRRFLRGQPIFSADRGHIHHRLLSLGHSPRKVALLLYGGCAILALGGMLLVNDSGYVAMVLVVIGLGVGLVIQRLRFAEFEELGRMLRRGVQKRGAIGRSVRMREASATLDQTESIEEFFERLEKTFESDRVARAEVRLRPSFLAGAPGHMGADRRLDDDVPIWIWSRANAHDPAWWEVKLPLFDTGGERMGALILWEDAGSDTNPLANLHVVAGELRTVMEQQLVALWDDSALEAEQELWIARAFERVLPSGRDGRDGRERARRIADAMGTSRSVALVERRTSDSTAA